MENKEPQYKDLQFKSKEDFESWLREKATLKIVFEDDGQDFLEWSLDENGEVLHSDLQARIWNGCMVNLKKIKVGKKLKMQNGDEMIHKVKELVILK